MDRADCTAPSPFALEEGIFPQRGLTGKAVSCPCAFAEKTPPQGGGAAAAMAVAVAVALPSLSTSAPHFFAAVTASLRDWNAAFLRTVLGCPFGPWFLRRLRSLPLLRPADT